MKMKTIAEAEAAGFTVDLHGAGRPYGYVGERFRPIAKVNCFTALEADLIRAMRNIIAFSGDSRLTEARGMKLLAEAAITRAEANTGNFYHPRGRSPDDGKIIEQKTTTTGEDHGTDPDHQPH